MSDSASLFASARRLIPGGVNSPVRACRAVGCDPLFIDHAAGSRLTSVEGRDYLDYVMSWGPLLLGHSHPVVAEALHKAVDRGVSYGAPCPGEVDLAQAVVDAVPGIEMVRMALPCWPGPPGSPACWPRRFRTICTARTVPITGAWTSGMPTARTGRST